MKCFCTLLLLIITGFTLAADVYVTDALTIQMRSGKGNDFRIISSIKVGTPLQILEIDEVAGYSKVTNPRGLEGWVVSQYLVETAPATARIVAWQEKIDDYKQLVIERDKLAALNLDLSAQLQQKQQSRLELDSLKQVQKNLQQLRLTIHRLAGQNRALTDQKQQNAFLLGMVAILAGLLLSFLIRWFFTRRSHTSHWR